jgi:competence protein ComEC
MRTVLVPSLILILVCALISYFVFQVVTGISVHKEPSGHLEVAFFNVGQGDATFIESPTGTQVLIDGGRGDRAVLRELSRAMGYFDRTIDVVVATHPDSDHIGGLIDVLKRYRVKTILMTSNVNDTPAYEAFMRAVDREDAQVVIATRGTALDLGSGARGSTTLAVLFPDRDVTNLESNTSSIVAKLSYGDADVLLTGDSPTSIEAYLVGLDGAALKSEVLKLGHHGSRTSSAPVFIETVAPQVGIISAGKDNEYGHPHREVVEIMKQYGVTTKNTASVGSIFMQSDGDTVWFK